MAPVIRIVEKTNPEKDHLGISPQPLRSDRKSDGYPTTGRYPMDIRDILKLLPHRYPMLLVDKVDIIEPGKRCIGVKNVTFNEPFFQGHYPGMPIMPGVLIVEAMAQVGACLLLNQESFAGKVPLIGAIDDIKFRRPVVPGDQLITEIEVLWVRGPIGKCKAVSKVDGEIAASFEMTFKLTEMTTP